MESWTWTYSPPRSRFSKIFPRSWLQNLATVLSLESLIGHWKHPNIPKSWDLQILEPKDFQALYHITQIAGRQQSQSQNPLLSLLQVPIMTKNTTQNHIILKTGIQPSSCNMTLFLTYPGPVLYQLWLPQTALASFLARWLVSLQRFLDALASLDFKLWVSQSVSNWYFLDFQ